MTEMDEFKNLQDNLQKELEELKKNVDECKKALANHIKEVDECKKDLGIHIKQVDECKKELDELKLIITQICKKCNKDYDNCKCDVCFSCGESDCRCY